MVNFLTFCRFRKGHRKLHARKRTCRLVAWGQWSIASQINLYWLILVLFSFSALAAKILLMQRFWRPALSSYFQEATRDVYFYRTANMSSAIAERIEGFEAMVQARADGLAQVVRNLWSPDNYVVQYWERCRGTDCAIEDSQNNPYWQYRSEDGLWPEWPF